MAESAPAAAAAAAPVTPVGPNLSVIKGPSTRVSSLGVVLKSGAALVGAAYGFDYVLKSAYHRHSVEHQRRHEFEGVLGEMRANRLAKFEQPRPIPPATNDIWSLDFSKVENVQKLMDHFGKSGKH